MQRGNVREVNDDSQGTLSHRFSQVGFSRYRLDTNGALPEMPLLWQGAVPVLAMRIIATPEDVCCCGHVKNFHVWLKHGELEPGESVVTIASCGHGDCACAEYRGPKRADEPGIT